MIYELAKPIPELTTRELKRHVAQVAILWNECPTGEKGAEDRQTLNDAMDALMAERRRRWRTW